MFGHALDPILKGLEYDKEFMQQFVWAFVHDAAALAELSAIAAQYIEEVGATLSNPVMMAMSGDPFAKSRQMLQQFTAKHGKH